VAIKIDEVNGDARYKVSVKDKGTYEVEGGEIVAGRCPACHGTGRVLTRNSNKEAELVQTNKNEETVEGIAEPEFCPVCDGMGMFDYSTAEINPA
jgi:RecJ-like exonuclease